MASKKRNLEFDGDGPAAPISVWQVVIAAVFLARFFVPAENVEQGHTLWIATAWFGLATVWGWWNWRLAVPIRWKPGLADVAVAALVFGHVLSAGVVLASQGDKRAALNSLWEWLALGIVWLLLQSALREASMRRLMSSGLLVSVLTLALLGIWQHLVWYPQQARETVQLLALGKKLELHQALTADERKQFEQLVRSHGPEMLTLDESGQQMMIDRAQHSLEPIGRFALANTFAALLAVGLVWCMDGLIRTLGMAGDGWRQTVLVGAGLVLVVCLLLTKSRTAYVGTAIAMAWLIVMHAVRSLRPTRLLAWSGLALGLVAVLTIGIWRLGGLDVEVLTEAKLSLGYRLEYWRATWQLIAEHPLFGVGPGNFRQHYLAFKPPGASDEILDPHNLVLDAWASGGLLGLLGIGTWVGLWLTRLWPPREHTIDLEAIPPAPLRPVLLAGLLTLLLVILEELVLEGFLDQQLLLLSTIWMGVAVVLYRFGRLTSASELAATGGGIAVLIHLCGAGGIGMPAIVQLLMLLTLMSAPRFASTHTAAALTAGWRSRWRAGLAVGSAASMLACVWTGLVPVVETKLLLEEGRYEMVVNGNVSSARSAFQAAAEADSLAAEPRQELALVNYVEWDRAGEDRADLFELAVQSQRDAVDRDPLSAKRRLVLAEWWMKRLRRTRDRQFAENAAQACRSALPLYPNYAPLRAEYAMALNATRDPAAAEQARTALQLDDLNRTHGHLEKLLPGWMRDWMKRIAASKT